MATRKGPLFSGFASGVTTGRLFDTALIKQDLLNHFNTRKGERVMDPEYGSIIWDLLFELKTAFTVEQIQNDVIRIVNTDRRVAIQSLDIIEQEHGYIVLLVLYFNELNIVEEFRVEFNQSLRLAQEVTV